MSENPVPACPVCRARFRGTAVCSRCGADLAPLMKIIVRAWRLRNQARRHLAVGERDRALACLADALALHDCPSARRLRASM